jgi:hypothetical protein
MRILDSLNKLLLHTSYELQFNLNLNNYPQSVFGLGSFLTHLPSLDKQSELCFPIGHSLVFYSCFRGYL